MELSDFVLPAVSIPAVLLISLTSVFLLLGHRWRWIAVSFGIQYVGVFILSALSWPLEMAIVKPVVGWIAGAILGIGMFNAPQTWESEELSSPSSRVLRVLAIILVGLFIFSTAPKIHEWLSDIGMESILGSLVLICMGLLHLGLTTHPFRVVVGLLTILSGFEILYANLEISALVAGLLSVAQLGLSLAGIILIIKPTPEELE